MKVYRKGVSSTGRIDLTVIWLKRLGGNRGLVDLGRRGKGTTHGPGGWSLDRTGLNLRWGMEL